MLSSTIHSYEETKLRIDWMVFGKLPELMEIAKEINIVFRILPMGNNVIVWDGLETWLS